MTNPRHFKFFVIGAGSGGIASARRAALHGAHPIGIAEAGALGGTCVNVGCIPKKILWYCASVREMLQECHHYGYAMNKESIPTFDWKAMKTRMDNSISRLNNTYKNALCKANIELFPAKAKFLPSTPYATDTPPQSSKRDSPLRLQVGDTIVTADHVLIATGSTPIALDAPGAEHCINSNDFFHMESFPQKAAVIGAGYISVELAGVLTLLGTQTHLVIRGKHPLRKFDDMLGTHLMTSMRAQGCQIHAEAQVERVEKDSQTQRLSVVLTNGTVLSDLDRVIVAVGRRPLVDDLDLKQLENGADKLQTPQGQILVDAFQNTCIPNLYALGDVCGKVELTPMAIAAGRLLADRLFGGVAHAQADYTNVPTVIFSHPPIGTIGMTEKEAREAFGDANVKVYKSTCVNTYYNVFDVPAEEKPKIHIKLICHAGEAERILGLCMIGMGVDEMLQGFAVAIKMGATKRDLDKCLAIHPTGAEEVVTLQPWML